MNKEVDQLADAKKSQQAWRASNQRHLDRLRLADTDPNTPEHPTFEDDSLEGYTQSSIPEYPNMTFPNNLFKSEKEVDDQS